MELNRVFDGDHAAPAAARRAVSAFDEMISAIALRDLQVVLTELVTNAIKYGSLGTTVGVWVNVAADGTIRGEVADAGSGGAVIDRTRPMEAGGLGLQIVDALCSVWCNPAGTGRVWFAFDAPTIV